MVAWILLFLLSVIALFVLLGNPIAGIRAVRAGRNYSAVPLIGGLTGCVACLICPIEPVRRFWWAPLILDYTISLFPVMLLWMLIRDRRQGRSRDDV